MARKFISSLVRKSPSNEFLSFQNTDNEDGDESSHGNDVLNSADAIMIVQGDRETELFYSKTAAMQVIHPATDLSALLNLADMFRFGYLVMSWTTHWWYFAKIPSLSAPVQQESIISNK